MPTCYVRHRVNSRRGIAGLPYTTPSVSPSPKKGHGKVAIKRALFNARQYVKRALSAHVGNQKGTFKFMHLTLIIFSL